MTKRRVSESANQQIGEAKNRGSGEAAARRSTDLVQHRAQVASVRGLALGRWLLLIGLLLAAAGASFAPWVDRPPAALKLTAPDLAEFVKFLPEVRDGGLTVRRLLFLLPLFATAFSLPLIVVAHPLNYPRRVRWPVLALVIPLALTILSPVWSPGVLLSAEFRLQTAGCLLCLGLVAASRWLRHIPTRLLLAPLIPLSLAAPSLALWQFFVVRQAVEHAYVSHIVPGWGTWATIAGFALVILAALLIVRDGRQPPPDQWPDLKPNTDRQLVIDDEFTSSLQLLPGNCVINGAAGNYPDRRQPPALSRTGTMTHIRTSEP